MKSCRPLAVLALIATQGFFPGYAATAGTPASRPAALDAALAVSDFRMTPAVKTAWIKSVKAETLASLAASGKTLPADFLAWVDSDPVVAATVYGARKNPAAVLLLLRSLEIDLGADTVRRDYAQLALAMAVVHANTAPADITPRAPLVLSIPGDPRVRVNTKDTSRPLDVNDHIVNFLEDHAPIEEDVVVGHRDEISELKYDDKGVAIPAPKKKPNRVAITEKRKRMLTAADVMASRALQQEFNAYMAAHGQSLSIDCGDGVIFPKRTAAVDGKSPEGRGILAAYKMFRAAYEAKGRLPAKRDAAPTPAERMAYAIRNDKFRFPEETAKERAWPRYPLTAPWPTLTLLAADDQPLREKEDIWVKFRDTGKTRTYGEYIGPIAQQFDFQSARRLAPFAFSYNTYQMMDKDGGVCGTMANMGVRTYNTLGIPSCTAGQPGHCALISFAFDAKTGAYRCHGGQYATGGDESTHPHTPWYFGDTDARRDMVWHQSVARAVNAGTQSFLDSMIAHRIFIRLSPEDKKAHGTSLLESGLALCPNNFVLVEDIRAFASTAKEQLDFYDKLAASPAGDATGALYLKTVRERMFDSIQKLDAPADAAGAAQVLARLEKLGCDNGALLVKYRVASIGLPALIRRTEAEFASHLAGERSENSCAFVAETVRAVAERITDKNERRKWSSALAAKLRGSEAYLTEKNKVATDDSAKILAKLTGTKVPPESELLKPLLERVACELRNSVAGARDLKSCKHLAARINALNKALKDESLKTAWADALTSILAGKETFTPANARKNAAPLRDPCADAIAALKPAKA